MEWTTTADVSNTGFWVQRSFNDAGNFSSVFFVPSPNHIDDLIERYQAPDTNAYRGSTFYRLRQVDVDGRSTYSKVIQVDGDPTVAYLKVYPNPSRELVYLQYPPYADGSVAVVKVYTSFGQLIYEGRSSTIDLSSQTSGIYIIECLQDKPLFAKVMLLK